MLEADLTAEQKEVWPNGIYKVADSTMFDLNAKWKDTDADYNEYLLTHESVLRADYTNSVVGNTKYLLAGQTAKIVMKTGDASGYEFSISKYDHDTHEFYLIPFRDESDTLLPNDVAKPAIGDDYTLVNIDMPASYVTAAEAELRAKAVEALAEGSTPKFPYSAVIDPKFVADNTLYFEVGDRLTIVDTDYDVNGTFRISRLVYNDYTRRYELTFAERRSLNRLQTIEKSVEKQERTASATNADSVENIRNSQITVGDLSRTLLDPVDKKLNADAVVRNKSIDPGMLSPDAGFPQVSLKDALVEPNYTGDEDKVNVGAGTLTVHNYNTLSRYEIAKLKAGGGTYDPTRTWTITGGETTLPTKAAHWLYAKINLADASTECTLEWSEDHRESKLDIATGYLRYKLGYVSKASSPRYACMVFGNVKLPRGFSAYEIAVQNGFVGTEVEWLASLQGSDGADGTKPIQITGQTISSTGWTLVSGLYEYDLANANITATSFVEVIPDNADIDTVATALVLPGTDSSAGSVKIYAKNEPTADIGCTINIYETN